MIINGKKIVIEDCLYYNGYQNGVEVPETLVERFKLEGFVYATIEHTTHLFVKEDSLLLQNGVDNQTFLSAPRLVVQDEAGILNFLGCWCSIMLNTDIDTYMSKVKGDTLLILKTPKDLVEVVGYGNCTNIFGSDTPVIIDQSVLYGDNEWVGFDLDLDTDAEEVLEELRESGNTSYSDVREEE